jgi:hypothetical protein
MTLGIQTGMLNMPAGLPLHRYSNLGSSPRLVMAGPKLDETESDLVGVEVPWAA